MSDVKTACSIIALVFGGLAGCGQGDPNGTASGRNANDIGTAATDSALRQNAVELRLLAAVDHIEGCFLRNGTVWADRERIYLASMCTPTLFVLQRDRDAGFPTVETITLPANATSVRGDHHALYVGLTDHTIAVFAKTWPLHLEVFARSSDDAAVGQLDVVQGNLYVGAWTASSAADRRHVYVSQVNEGDDVRAISTRELAAEYTASFTFAAGFESNTTRVFDRRSGDEVGSFANPLDIYGRPAVVDLYSDSKTLYLTIGGCCGSGIYRYDASTLQPQAAMLCSQDPLTCSTNAVVVHRGWLVAGTEGGVIRLFQAGVEAPALLDEVRLRDATGHLGSEDIEIRALWADDSDDLIFAGSSWGNDQSRSPDLPAFFVLQATRPTL